MQLAAFGLTAYDNAGRLMDDTDGRVGLVDVLAAGAAGAVGLDLKILVTNFDAAVIL